MVSVPSTSGQGGVRRVLERAWRIFGSALLFSSFGIGAVVLAGLIPIVSLLGAGRSPRDLMAQRWIQRAFALFVQLGVWLRVWDWAGSNLDRLRQGPYLVIANHPTLMDVVFLISFMPQADCVVKRAAWSNPALGGIVRAAGYIQNDEGGEIVEACADRLRAGRSVLLFPEGSRSPDDGLRAFRRGAAHIALRTGHPILPVVINCNPPTLKKGQPWYDLPNEIFRYTFTVGDPVCAEDLLVEDLVPAAAARRVNSWMRSYFQKRLKHGIA